MTAVPTVREVSAADLTPGMRLEWGGTWQPPVCSVTTWGPAAGEAPSYPHIWWTRVTVREADDRFVPHFYRPGDLTPVVEQVVCSACGALAVVDEAVAGHRRVEHRVELFDLCPQCADGPAAGDGALRTSEQWCRVTRVRVLDPDGWRRFPALPWDAPITRRQFEYRASLSTCEMPAHRNGD